MGRGRAVPSRRVPRDAAHAPGELPEVPSGAADRPDRHHDDAPARRRAGSASSCAATVGPGISAAPIDVAFVGIGENSHLAFNDPPADFDTREPYIVVSLDDACRRQQFGEGWFPTLADVPIAGDFDVGPPDPRGASHPLHRARRCARRKPCARRWKGPSPTRCPPRSCRRTRRDAVPRHGVGASLLKREAPARRRRPRLTASCLPSLVHRRPALSLDRHQLHRSPDAQRAGAAPEDGVPLDELRLRADAHRVPRRVCRRTDVRGPGHRRAGHAPRPP